MNREDLRRKIRENCEELRVLAIREASRVIAHFFKHTSMEEVRQDFNVFIGPVGKEKASDPAGTSKAIQTASAITDLFCELHRIYRKTQNNAQGQTNASYISDVRIDALGLQTEKALEELCKLLRPIRKKYHCRSTPGRGVGRVWKVATEGVFDLCITLPSYTTQFRMNEFGMFLENYAALPRVMATIRWTSLLRGFIGEVLEHDLTKNDFVFLSKCLFLVKKVKDRATIRDALALITKEPMPELSIKYIRALEKIVSAATLEALANHRTAYPELLEVVNYLSSVELDPHLAKHDSKFQKESFDGMRGFAHLISDYLETIKNFRRSRNEGNHALYNFLQYRMHSLSAEFIESTRWLSHRQYVEDDNTLSNMAVMKRAYRIVSRGSVSRPLYSIARPRLLQTSHDAQDFDDIFAILLEKVHPFDRTLFDLSDAVARCERQYRASSAQRSRPQTVNMYEDDVINLDKLVTDYIKHLQLLTQHIYPNRKDSLHGTLIDIASPLLLDSIHVNNNSKNSPKTATCCALDATTLQNSLAGLKIVGKQEINQFYTELKLGIIENLFPSLHCGFSALCIAESNWVITPDSAQNSHKHHTLPTKGDTSAMRPGPAATQVNRVQPMLRTPASAGKESERHYFHDITQVNGTKQHRSGLDPENTATCNLTFHSTTPHTSSQYSPGTQAIATNYTGTHKSPEYRSGALSASQTHAPPELKKPKLATDNEIQATIACIDNSEMPELIDSAISLTDEDLRALDTLLDGCNPGNTACSKVQELPVANFGNHAATNASYGPYGYNHHQRINGYGTAANTTLALPTTNTTKIHGTPEVNTDHCNNPAPERATLPASDTIAKPNADGCNNINHNKHPDIMSHSCQHLAQETAKVSTTGCSNTGRKHMLTGENTSWSQPSSAKRPRTQASSVLELATDGALELAGTSWTRTAEELGSLVNDLPLNASSVPQDIGRMPSHILGAPILDDLSFSPGIFY